MRRMEQSRGDRIRVGFFMWGRVLRVDNEGDFLVLNVNNWDGG